MNPSCQAVSSSHPGCRRAVPLWKVKKTKRILTSFQDALQVTHLVTLHVQPPSFLLDPTGPGGHAVR